MAGYSSKPLAQKLGIKPAATVFVINEPANYRELLGDDTDGVEFSDRVPSNPDFIHFFITRRSGLEEQLNRLRSKIRDTGTLLGFVAKKISRGVDRCD